MVQCGYGNVSCGRVGHGCGGAMCRFVPEQLCFVPMVSVRCRGVGTSDATALLSDARCWLRLAVPGCCIARRCHGIV